MEQKLFLIFHSRAEYERAIEFFDNQSDFFPYDKNDEFRCFTFEEDGNIDALEQGISDELAENGFEDYYFE